MRAFCVPSAKMNTSAPNLTSRETRRATVDSSPAAGGLAEVFAVDVARKEVGGGDGHDGRRHQRADRDRRECDAYEPAGEAIKDQRGNRECPTICFEARRVRRVGDDAAAIAMKPSNAISASRNEYAGSNAAFRLITFRLFEAKTPVTECG